MDGTGVAPIMEIVVNINIVFRLGISLRGTLGRCKSRKILILKKKLMSKGICF
jgi:hypothetical protein